MIRNYFKIALRNLKKYKQFSLINILGLSFAIAVALSLLLYVNDELSYDQFHPEASQIYRITMHTQIQEKDFNSAWTPSFIGSRMAEEMAEIKESATLYKHFKGYSIRKGDEEIALEDVYYASPNFFDFFGFELKYGTAVDVLSEPRNIVLHEKLANKLFPGESIMGKTIETTSGTMKITGLIADKDYQSHFTPMVVSSIIGRWDIKDLSTSTNLDAAYYNYVKVANDAVLDLTKIDQHKNRYFNEWISQEQSRQESFRAEATTLQFQNIRDIHLNSNIEFEMEANGDQSTVMIFAFIASLILLVASINYTNLASARYLERMKELGIRKVLGSLRRQLAMQYFVESLVITGISATMGWIMVQFTLPTFNDLSGKSLQISQLFTFEVLLGFILIILLCSLLSSIYPSLFISGIKPISVFKLAGSGTGKGSGFRKAMLLLQIVTSGILLVFTFVVFQQLQYMQNRDLGFQQEQVMVLEVKAREARAKLPILKQELLKLSAIAQVGLSGQVPGSDNLKTEPFGFEDNDGSFAEILTNYMFTGPDIVPTLGLHFEAGVNFNPDNGGANRGQEVIVNETLVKSMNWKEPIGKKVKLPIGEATVVGVVNDFHLKSMHQKIAPLTMIYLDNWAEAALIKLQTDQLSSTIAEVEQVYKSVLGNIAFDYSFLDERFARQYQADQRNAKIFVLFSILTLIIAGMGLLGLVGFSLARRVKEISIRRVFGANSGQMILLLFREYALVLLVGVAIIVPVGNYLIVEWLMNFPYRMEIDPFHFALPIAGLLIFTTLIIVARSYSTSRTNPANVLKEE